MSDFWIVNASSEEEEVLFKVLEGSVEYRGSEMTAMEVEVQQGCVE